MSKSIPLIEWWLNRYGLSAPRQLLLLGIVSAIVTGCTKVTIPVAEPPVTLVRTATVLQAEDHETFLFPCIAKEAKSINLSFRVPGNLLEFNVKIGQRITKDTVIAKLDPRDYALTIQRFESEWTCSETPN